MNNDIDWLYENAQEKVKEKFEGPENTLELIACVEELFCNQPFAGKILNVRGKPEAFLTSISVSIFPMLIAGFIVA